QSANRYRNGYNDLRSKITFGLHATTQGQNLIGAIKAGLSAEKLLIEERHDSYHLRILIDTRTEQANSMGFDLARSAITLTTQNHLGSTLGSNKLNITGQSTQGYAIARENVAIKLKHLIDKEGIESILGLAF
ncbi:MAG: hypothetical protein MUP09_04630, partial [Thiovulaceae bacterium]|nr:hypothetical protein [Sulfurimonadaceae bacterium]